MSTRTIANLVFKAQLQPGHPDYDPDFDLERELDDYYDALEQKAEDRRHGY